MTDVIETFKLDDSRVHKLALEVKNERLTQEQKEEKAKLPGLKYKQDFRRRVLLGGPLSFIEAKYMVRELLTHDKWKITFYEVAQSPQVVYFETEFQAKKYFKRATVYGKGAKGGKIMAQTMELYGPADHIYGERREISAWQSPNYKPDPIISAHYC